MLKRTLGVCVLAVALVAGGAQPGMAIVGGHNASENYSFAVSLGNCGGSLIKPQWVVTATHCVREGLPQKVRVGGNDVGEPGTDVRVTEAISHPKEGGKTIDVTLLRLEHPVEQTPVRLAPTAGGAGTKVRMLGWGRTCEDGCTPEYLQELDTQLLDIGQCFDLKGRFHLCVADNNGAQSCSGDSGGPLLVGTPGDWRLIGGLRGDGDTNPDCANGPSVWSDFTVHADWIEKNTSS